MRNIPSLALVIVFFFISSASASSPIGQHPTGICTRDINPWGHASNCSCSDDGIYDARAGLCFKDSHGKKIMVQGPISAGMVAIGGETTGFVLTTPQGVSYELIVKVDDQEKLYKLSGMWFEVAGDLISILSVERGPRKAIIIDSLSVLE